MSGSFARQRVLAGQKEPGRKAEALSASVSGYSSAPMVDVAIFRKASCACGGGCPACQEKSSDLKVSRPNDPAEIEADQIADKVMRMPDQESAHTNSNGKNASPINNVANPSAIHRKCDACEDEEEVTETLQRKEGSTAAPDPPPGDPPPTIKNVISSGGRLLDADTRSFFEPRFGIDLGHVRIHADSAAVQSARSINAKAYTLGSNIVFAKSEYQPEADGGKRLVAHELAHVVQQGTGKIQQLQRQQADQPASEDDSAPPRSTMISRAETCPPPDNMSCTPATDSPGAVTNTITFLQNEHLLNGRQQEEIEAAAGPWNDVGGLVTVRIDGYASAEGECGYNWELSCRRAQSIAMVLEHPADSLGVPSGSVELFAHGEDNEFGSALPENRKVTISFPGAPDPSLSTPSVDEDPCSEEHETESRVAINNAYHAIRQTIHVINEDPLSSIAEDALRYYFGEGYSRGTITLRLGELQSFLRDGVALECADPSSDPECRPDVLAYAHSLSPLISRLFNDRTIHVCQPNFHHLTASMRIATMVHEASHLYLGTDDNAIYSEVDCSATPETTVLSDHDRSLNADSYGCLVYRLGLNP